jgi:hypothetical protein
MVDLPQYGNVFPDDILARLRDLESAVNDLQDGTFAAVVTLAGDVTGDSSATVVGQLQGYPVSATAPASGEVLEWDGSAWTPTALGGGTGDVVQSNYNTLTNSPLTYTSLRGTTQAPTWRMERSSGTGASPTALAGGLTIGAFTFGGYTGSAWTSSAVAGLYAKTTQTFSGSAQGTYLSLETTEADTTSRSEALRVTDRGDLLNVRGFPSLRPDTRFAYQQRAASLYLSQASTSLVTEVYIADSTGHFKLSPVSDAETKSCIAVYDIEMCNLYNLAPRTSGYVPVQQYGVVAVSGMQWDTVQGSRVARGPAYQNMRLTGSEQCQITRYGTAVTVFYTAQDSGGGTATVTINGSTAGTITSTDGTLAAGTYDSGRSVTYYRSGYGPIDLTVALTSGTAFELEGAYFHNQNASGGFLLIRADKSGQSMSYINNTPDPLMQVIANNQPQLVTIQLGINDVREDGSFALTADELVTEFEALLTNIRDQYATWTPAIRYVFQNQSAYVPDDYSTAYRTAMRNACVKNDVLFIDGHDAVGSIDGSDPLDVSDDGLHPNERGHWVWGQAVFDATPRGARPRRINWALNDSNAQIMAVQNVRMVNTTGGSIYLARDEGSAATTSGVQLGALGFQGVSDAYGTLGFGAAIRGDSEDAWTSSSRKAGLRFMTTSATTLTVRGGFTNGGTFFIGATSGSAVASIDASGNATFNGTLSVTGHPTLEGVTATGATGTGALVYSTSPTLTTPNIGAATATSISGPVFTLDNAFNTITGTVGTFGAVAFGNSPTLTLRRAQGTSGSPTNITSGITLGGLSFAGYNSDGTYYTGAVVRAVSEEAWSTAAYRGSRLEFLTAATASGTAVAVRALIDNAGNFYVGATAAAAKFSVTGSSGNTTVSGTLGVTGNTTLSGTLSVTGHPTLEGVTATGATGTGKLVFDTSPTLVTPTIGAATASSLTASVAQNAAVLSVTQGTINKPVMELISTSTGDDPTEEVRQYRLQTTSNNATTLADASLPASSTTLVQAWVVARRTTGGGSAEDGAGYILTAAFQAGVQIGSTSQTIVGENQSAWDATLNYNSSKWRVVVTGAASTTITWHATVRVWSVGS